MHYTYLHRRLSDNAPFYIGKGTRRDRMKVTTGRSERWSRTVAKHGFKAEVVSVWPTEDEAFTHERFLIACFRSMGHDICNHTDGGEGACGFKQSEETKALRNGKLRGRMKSPETITRMKAAKAGYTVPHEMREQISKTLMGRYPCGLNPNAKAVRCVDTDAIFTSMQEAAGWLRSIGHEKASFKNIHAAVSGAKKTAYGLRWVRA